MRGSTLFWLTSIALLSPGSGAALAQPANPEGSGSRRVVLVELYTSQGCDMCPEAEKNLGILAGRERRIVPIAFHVDYFNRPWKDPFSEALYSQRQMAFNSLYTKPKNKEYGLYYTPMMMIDGEQSINGRDPAGAEAAIRRALAKKPQVTLKTTLELTNDTRTGKLAVKVAPRSPVAQDKELLVCAVLREDGVVTKVESGENAKKTLTARFPARATKFSLIELKSKGESEKLLSFTFDRDPAWNVEKLDLAVFVQDKATGVIYQAADLPWRSTPGTATSEK
ncbi:DUF1223 domain-containing protein [Singulisphaera acidiphila]|uniref:Uncharacterized secreted protein n=1 Tax=Singulisphaera acidiphila (strain ATCC BAA-1392 / DSM 18658 / VKM B-2454 / MOB10) TaxID=886293 RepID=L0DEP5_SINAD|nr:DUF1223 domain-containing protein [Singulisphaera acidiphila]AGA27732.1 uncharacterized secreted protein [Singulisphaera acidiphila DSM 18658]